MAWSVQNKQRLNLVQWTHRKPNYASHTRSFKVVEVHGFHGKQNSHIIRRQRHTYNSWYSCSVPKQYSHIQYSFTHHSHVRWYALVGHPGNSWTRQSFTADCKSQLPQWRHKICHGIWILQPKLPNGCWCSHWSKTLCHPHSWMILLERHPISRRNHSSVFLASQRLVCTHFTTRMWLE